MIRRRRLLLRAAVVCGGAYAAGWHMAKRSNKARRPISDRASRT